MFVFLVLFVFEAYGYDLKEHYREFGFVKMNESLPFCFFTIIDNIHLLTSASCMAYSLIPLNTPAILSSKLAKSGVLKRFTNDGKLGNPEILNDMLIYPYAKLGGTQSFVDGDFTIIRLKKKLPLEDGLIIAHWPFKYIHKDLEYQIDEFEQNKETAIVWTHLEVLKEPLKLKILTGHLIDKNVCREMLKCDNKVDIHNWCSLPPNFNIRCIYHEKEAHCRIDTRGSPVIINHIIWGLVVNCHEKITFYLGFDRSFKFIQYLIVGKKYYYLTEEIQKYGGILAVLVVVIIIAVVVFGFLLLVKVIKRQIESMRT